MLDALLEANRPHLPRFFVAGLSASPRGRHAARARPVPSPAPTPPRHAPARPLTGREIPRTDVSGDAVPRTNPSPAAPDPLRRPHHSCPPPVPRPVPRASRRAARAARPPARSPSSSSCSWPASASSAPWRPSARTPPWPAVSRTRDGARPTYVLPEETVVYDRTGEVELARFGDFKREVVTFDEIPPIVLDATTAVEDKTFWENAGFDPLGIVAAGLDSIRGSGRGASTITQQLVRARLLDADLVQDRDRTAERKLKEIIQSIRVTQAFEGEDGKQEIITAYLNQNYYGNQTLRREGGATSATSARRSGRELTPSEAALLAALPQSPSNYDLVRNAIVALRRGGDRGGALPGERGDPRGRPRDARSSQRRNRSSTCSPRATGRR